MPRSERETAFVCVQFLRRSNDRGGQAPALRARKGFSSPCAVRDQAIPNYSLLKGLTALKRCFSRVLSRGTGPRATIKNVPFTVGRGPVPRRASIGETALVGVRFSRRSDDRGGQAPALRARERFASPCAFREQALPNYSLLLIVIILKILLISCSSLANLVKC